MTDSILRVLQETEDLKDKSAIVAEAVFALLPKETALAARRSVILHWFDQFVLEAILEDCQLTIDEMSDIYEQLIALPFIDKVPSGLTFQNLTREGLVKLYSRTQPELLRIAASLAAPSYEMREEDKKSVAEALFCYVVAGDQEAGISLQNFLLEDASSHQDWQHLNNLLQLQEEAEQLPFVQSLPRSEQELLIRGLVHRIQNKRYTAILEYGEALAINPKSVLAYVSRGTTYTEQGQSEVALIDFNKALYLDKNFAQAYLGRGIVYTKQGQYIEALKDSDRAIRLGLCNENVLINKGNALTQLERYEEALVTYEEALHFNANAVTAYIGKGQAFNELGQYQEALEAYEEALRLDPNLSIAYLGKGQTLNGLERYSEALIAYENAIRVNPNNADAYRGKGQALSRLKRYAEATSAYQQANHLDPQTEETTIEGEDEDNEEIVDTQGAKRSNTGNDKKPATFSGRRTNTSSSSQDPTRRTSSLFWKGIKNSFTIFIVAIIILVSALLFRTVRTPLINIPNPNVTPISSMVNTHSKQTPEPRLELSFHRLNYTGIDYQGLLNNSQSAKDDLKQRFRNESILQGRSVGLAIVYAGVPDTTLTDQASNISSKVYGALRELGQENFVFQKASYYDNLYVLGNDPGNVIIDVYFLSPSSSGQTPEPRLESSFHRLNYTGVDYQGLLNDSPTAKNDLKRRFKNESVLKGRRVGLAIVYAGAPDTALTDQASNISSKVYGALRELGQENFVFQKASYYDNLYVLGNDPGNVIIDVFLFG